MKSKEISKFNRANILYLELNVPESIKEKVRDILRESENPYESFVHTFGKDVVKYDELRNAFIFDNIMK